MTFLILIPNSDKQGPLSADVPDAAHLWFRYYMMSPLWSEWLYP